MPTTRPRFSVVIPTRGNAHTLPFTLQTCIAQSFTDCEFLVSDNSGGDTVRETLARFDDSRLRYVRTPKLLALTDSWEYAVSHALGEYVTVLGGDDGLLLHALREIDAILRRIRAPLLRWESISYTWPDLPPTRHAISNELLLPLKMIDGYHPIHQLDARPMILAAANAEVSYSQLPMIYCSAVHQGLLERLRARTGRVFRSQCPDVYSAFALAYLAGSYHSCSAPMSISGLSGASNGVAELYLGGRSPITEEFRRLNAGAGHDPHPQVPDLPLMSAKVADSFMRVKEALFPTDAALTLNRQALLARCLADLQGCSEFELAAAASAIRKAIGDDPALLAWVETRWREARPAAQTRPVGRRYGGSYVRFDVADLGVRDVYGAAQLCERLLGYEADGVNAHLEKVTVTEEPSRPLLGATSLRSAPHAIEPELHHQPLDLTLLLRLYEQLSQRTVIDVGAGKGSFVDAFLAAGCPRLWAVEPYPPHAAHLRERFANDPRVHVLEPALGVRDATVDLRIAEDRAGQEYRYFHSVARMPDTDAVRWNRRLSVSCRSLDSLVEDGTLPPEVGILKIDTEGYDFEVLLGGGRLSASVVMVEYWDTIPALGPCPHSLAELACVLAKRGYANGIVIKRHDEFEILQLGSFSTRAGDWGNAIFVHDIIWPKVESQVRDAVAEVQSRLLDTTLHLATHARRRLETIEQLKAQRDRLKARRDELEAERKRPRAPSWLEVHRRRVMQPRLGSLEHYPPRPLEIPAHYAQEPLVESGPAISIVTPTLNSERFLERTLRSVLDQAYTPLEFTVKDGGSSDGTLSVLDRYRDRLVNVQTGRDAGQADALNQGFRQTTGELMAYLNSDDLLLPGTLRYVARYFLAHPSVDVVYGHRILVDENDQEIGRWVLPPHDSKVLSWVDYVPQETLFWRRRIWELAGARLDETLHFAMDWDLLLRFRAAGARFARLPRFLGAFRVHKDQKTSARMIDVGAHEMARLRERQHGRPVTAAEIHHHVRGYLLRHMVSQKLYRLGILSY